MAQDRTYGDKLLGRCSVGERMSAFTPTGKQEFGVYGPLISKIKLVKRSVSNHAIGRDILFLCCPFLNFRMSFSADNMIPLSLGHS